MSGIPSRLFAAAGAVLFGGISGSSLAIWERKRTVRSHLMWHDLTDLRKFGENVCGLNLADSANKDEVIEVIITSHQCLCSDVRFSALLRQVSCLMSFAGGLKMVILICSLLPPLH